MPEEGMIRKMIAEAEGMLEYSHIPYSGFAVGAALLAANGTIYTGCNIENAAFSPGICAERTAFAKAVSEGVKDFRAIVIVGGRDRKPSDYCPPCGVCRQVMMEFCDPKTFEVILAKSPDDYIIRTLEELLPMGFGPMNLEAGA